MTDKNTIDAAIDKIDQQINEHRKSSGNILLIVLVVGILFFLAGAYIYQAENGSGVISEQKNNTEEIVQKSSLNNQTKTPAINEGEKTLNKMPSSFITEQPLNSGGIEFGAGIYQGGGISGASINWGMSFSKEKILYILVALFVVIFGVMMAIYRFHLSEISRSEQYRFGLLRIRISANNFEKEGFKSEVRESLTKDAFNFSTGRGKNIDSPLPGHPTSDLGALLTNKLIDAIDVKVSPKKEV